MQPPGINDQPSPRLERIDTRFSQLLPNVDPFTPTKHFWSGFLDALLATALIRYSIRFICASGYRQLQFLLDLIISYCFLRRGGLS